MDSKGLPPQQPDVPDPVWTEEENQRIDQLVELLHRYVDRVALKIPSGKIGLGGHSHEH